jgi:hypothetical protein
LPGPGQWEERPVHRKKVSSVNFGGHNLSMNVLISNAGIIIAEYTNPDIVEMVNYEKVLRTGLNGRALIGQICTAIAQTARL